MSAIHGVSLTGLFTMSRSVLSRIYVLACLVCSSTCQASLRPMLARAMNLSNTVFVHSRSIPSLFLVTRNSIWSSRAFMLTTRRAMLPVLLKYPDQGVQWKSTKCTNKSCTICRSAPTFMACRPWYLRSQKKMRPRAWTSH